MAERKPFPREIEEFNDDERISYSMLSKTYLLEDENGVEWEWMPAIAKWTQTVTEEEMKQQAEAYKVAGVDEDEPALNPAQKRKRAQMEDPEENPKAPKTGPAAAQNGDSEDTTATVTATATDATAANANAAASASAKPAAPRPITAVYVTGLPLDTDEEEIRDYFCKFGIIAESIDNDSKRIKMYADANGNFKGDALIIFNNAYSVPQALLYDGEPLREGDSQKMTIERANRSSKSNQQSVVASNGNSTRQNYSKAKVQAKHAQMNSRLNWEGSDDYVDAENPDKHLKTVLIKKAFSLNDLDEDETLLSDIYDDMKEVAEEYGKVKNVTVFDLEPQGVVTIRFSTAAAAKKCAEGFNGRKYNSRTLYATVSDGLAKFRKETKTEAQKAAEKEAAERKRLDDFAKDIEAEAVD